MSRAKVLVVSHSHPQFSKGGAEIAAWQLFSGLAKCPGHQAWFLGCVRDPNNQKPGATIFQPFSQHEFLYAAGVFDWFKFSNPDPAFPREFRALLLQLQPHVVHFHHYGNIGVEALLHVRETLPDCKIVLTLHEYLAVCHHFGQMVTKPGRTLCYEASPTRCATCFKDTAPSDFFLRKLYIERFFRLVDHFIAPSEFLAARYVAWGVPRERISIIENVIPAPLHERRPQERGRADAVLRVGFFGQVSFLKGINVLIEAAQILEERAADNIVFEIHGDYSGQPPEFQAELLERLTKVGRNVKFRGPYEQASVDQLMQAVDLVLIPSIWWENSPVVIQEALRNRRPIVCSDIGGMAEKIQDGVDGFYFPVGNSLALAALLQDLARKPDTLAKVAGTMRFPPQPEVILSRHKRLYASLH